MIIKIPLLITGFIFYIAAVVLTILVIANQTDDKLYIGFMIFSWIMVLIIFTLHISLYNTIPCLVHTMFVPDKEKRLSKCVKTSVLMESDKYKYK